jgi:hypothetical protein
MSQFYHVNEKRAKKLKDWNFSDILMAKKEVKSCPKERPHLTKKKIFLC